MKLSLNRSKCIKSKNAIDALFAQGKGFVAFPMRVVYSISESAADVPPVQIMVVAQKKRFKHAVDRNRYKRLMREAYRLHQQPLGEAMQQQNRCMQIAFIAISDTLPTFAEVEHKMQQVIEKLANLEA